jgi:hypothetical protein
VTAFSSNLRPRLASAAVIVMDTELEESIGLGSAWPYRTLGYKEVHVTSSLLRAIGVRPQCGDRAVIEFSLMSLFQVDSDLLHFDTSSLTLY